MNVWHQDKVSVPRQRRRYILVTLNFKFQFNLLNRDYGFTLHSHSPPYPIPMSALYSIASVHMPLVALIDLAYSHLLRKEKERGRDEGSEGNGALAPSVYSSSLALAT